MTDRLTVLSFPRRRPTLLEITALMDRYRAIKSADKWRVLDRETGDMLPGEFFDLPGAIAGARLAAASAIHAITAR